MSSPGKTKYKITHNNVKLRSTIYSIRSIHQGLRYPCTICDYQATQQGDLTKHKRSIHQGLKYPCTVCEYQATQQGDLIKHKKSSHQGLKYPCTMCGFTTSFKSNLNRHIQSKHRETCKFQCHRSS